MPCAGGGFCEVFVAYWKQDGKTEVKVSPRSIRLRVKFDATVSGCSQNPEATNTKVFGSKKGKKFAYSPFASSQLPLQNLVQEVMIWHQLDHPNIIRFLGLAHNLGISGSSAIITPFCNNGVIMGYLKDYPDKDRLPLASFCSPFIIYINCSIYIYR